jgi:hypothetical protein
MAELNFENPKLKLTNDEFSETSRKIKEAFDKLK